MVCPTSKVNVCGFVAPGEVEGSSGITLPSS